MRSVEEDIARSQARSFCLRLGAKIHKHEKKGYICVTECDQFPQGIITAFHGWVDVMNRLTEVVSEPDLVTDGFYLKGTETFQ